MPEPIVEADQFIEIGRQSATPGDMPPEVAVALDRLRSGVVASALVRLSAVAAPVLLAVQVVPEGVSTRRVARSRWRMKKPPASSPRPNITAAPIPNARHAKPRVGFAGCDVTAAAACVPRPYR